MIVLQKWGSISSFKGGLGLVGINVKHFGLYGMWHLLKPDNFYIQELKPDDPLMSRTFVGWMLKNYQGDSDFGKKIIFSSEAHYHLSGHVNKQNCRIWDRDNPRVI